MSLNDVCNWLHLESGVLEMWNAPSKNRLPYANKVHNAEFAEKRCWSVLSHLQHAIPNSAARRKGRSLHRRLKVRVHAMDSTVIQSMASCMDRTKHRRLKAASKMHLRIDLHSFLPSFAIVETTGQHDNTNVREVCTKKGSGFIMSSLLDGNAYI